jgi:hypothetical protein
LSNSSQVEAAAMVWNLSEFHKALVFRYGINSQGELVIMRTL